MLVPPLDGVLVTGAQGFVGSWLVDRLVEDGASVVVPRRAAAAGSRFAEAGLERRTTAVAVDLEEPVSVLRTLDEHGVGLVFHLAARTAPTVVPARPGELLDSNLRSTAGVLDALRLAKERGAPVRAVLASSSLAYGRPERQPVPEDEPLRALPPYPVSKAACDAIARSYATTFGLPLALTRISNLYGGGDPHSARLVPSAIAAIRAGERPVIRSDGTPEREYLFVRDAVSAYLAVARSLDDPARAGRAWNVGSGTPVSVRTLVERTIAAAGAELEPDVRGAPRANGGADRLALDSSAIRDELGWSAEWDLDAGLSETWRWYASAAGRA
jgi:CDP-glucose 4,6-dehydratase